jgi:chemotaxis protein methyltransferase CheR
VKDTDCVAFLQWALPRMKLRWPGFRRVRRQACKRIQRRMTELSCADVAAYRRYLEGHPAEWDLLDGLCRITVTRFYRDRQVFQVLVGEVLPELARSALARQARELRIWCAGCGSGEEPYTLAIAWHMELAGRFPGLDLKILASDFDAELLSRAAEACYAWSAVKNLPEGWHERAIREHDGRFCLEPAFTEPVTLLCHDVRTPLDAGPFDLILCRNLAFTYFEPGLQREAARALHDRLRPGGVLLLGVRERLPEGGPRFEVISKRLSLYRRPPAGGAVSGAGEEDTRRGLRDVPERSEADAGCRGGAAFSE